MLYLWKWFNLIFTPQSENAKPIRNSINFMQKGFERLRCNSGDIVVGLNIPTSSICSYSGGRELIGNIVERGRGSLCDVISTNVCSDILLVSRLAKEALEEFGACSFERVRFSPELGDGYWLIVPEVIHPRFDGLVYSYLYDSIPFNQELGRYRWIPNDPFVVDGGRIEANQLFVSIATLGYANIFISSEATKVIKQKKLKAFGFNTVYVKELDAKVSMF